MLHSKASRFALTASCLFGIGAAVLIITTIETAFADDYDDAQEAAGIMAAAKICNTVVSDDLRRSLYLKMLTVMKEPSRVNFAIDQEIELLSKLSPSDRTAMCLAIGDQVRSLAP